MFETNVIPFAPALKRRRHLTAGVALLSWDNHFPGGIDDLWTGPFSRAQSGTVVRLFLH